MADDLRLPLTDDQLSAIVEQEIASSSAYDNSALNDKRTRAIEYMRGELTQWPAEVGRSSVTSRDTSDIISWVLPGIIRLYTASGTMAIAEPVEPSDEQWSKQATAGLNYVFWKDNPGYQILYDVTYDSLLHADGIVKHWWDDTPKTRVSFHTGLSDEQLVALLTPQDDSVDEDGEACETIEVLAHSKKTYTVPGAPDPQTGQSAPMQVMAHDVKIKRTNKYGCIKLACVAPENFLISSEAITIRDARMVGVKERKTRSDLIRMGFDRDKVRRVSPDWDDDSVYQARHEWSRMGDGAATEALEECWLHELYVKLDVDGDGMAETVQIFYAGQQVLEWSVWEDEDVFTEVPCEPVPHRFDGNSVFDKTMDVQEIKTVLKRELLNNSYAHNNPTKLVTGRIHNPDALVSPAFGVSILGETGATIEPVLIPFVGDKIIAILDFFDSVLEKRTGVSRQSMALDPEALQNQTATASQLAHDAAYSQTELIARNQAEYGGWKGVFKAILKLMIRHQNKPRMIRLEGAPADAPQNEKWMEIDPRHWNADMDITINTGLGTGSRDRDMAMLRSVLNDQTLLATAFKEAGMIDKAVAMIPMMIATMTKMAEAAGIKSPEMFYPKVMPQDVQNAIAGIAKAAQEGDPKVKAQKEIEAAKIEAKQVSDQQELALKAQQEQMQAAAQAQVEAAQAQADLIVEDNKRKTEEYLAGVEARFEAIRLRLEQSFEAIEKQKDRDLQWKIAQLGSQDKKMAAEKATEAKAKQPNGATQ